MLGSHYGIVLLVLCRASLRTDHYILKETQFQFKAVCLVIMVGYCALLLDVGLMIQNMGLSAQKDNLSCIYFAFTRRMSVRTVLLIHRVVGTFPLTHSRQ